MNITVKYQLAYYTSKDIINSLEVVNSIHNTLMYCYSIDFIVHSSES